MRAEVKKDPVRIRVPKYGNALMLCMEYLSDYRLPVIKRVHQLDEHFDIELMMTAPAAQPIKRYINANLGE
jgi:hypothetical protein